MGFSLKKLGRALDPTSKTSALGSVVRMGIGALPGGSAALEAVNAAGKVRLNNPAKPAAAGPAPTAANALPKPAITIGQVQLTRNQLMMLGVAAALAAYLVLKRR